MSGVIIVGTLLRTFAPLTVLVPAQWIKAGTLPADAPLDALLVRCVSRTDRQPLRRGGSVRAIERVAVTVRATSYRRQQEILRLARRACAGFTGDVAGAVRVAILTAGLGPDLTGPGDSFEQTQDFRVSFEEPA